MIRILFSPFVYALLSGILFAFQVFAQGSKKEIKLDSLLNINADYSLQDTIKIEYLGRIAVGYSSISDYPKALDYFQQALALAIRLNDTNRCMRFYGNIGIEYTAMANYPKALTYHQKSLFIAEQLENKSAIAGNFNNIGRVFMFLGDYPKALEYYQKALSMSEASGNKLACAKQLRNIGNTYHKMGNYPKALANLEKSQQLFEELGNKDGESISMGIIGSVYFSLSDFEKSLEFHQKALDLNRSYGNKRQESMNRVNIGKVYREASDMFYQKIKVNPSQRYQLSIDFIKMGQQLAKEISDAGSEKIAWDELRLTYEKQGDYINAYNAYKNFILLRDSIEGNEIKNTIAIKELQYDFEKRETKMLFTQQLTAEKLHQQELLTLQQQQDINLKQQQLLLTRQEKDIQLLAYLKTKAELQQQKNIGEKQLAITAQKDAELKLLNKEKHLQEISLELTTKELMVKVSQRNGFIIGTVLLLFFAGAVVIGLKQTSAEKKKSESLLLNILPSEVANELKKSGEAIAKQYNHVTVLFTDFVNFTGISEQLSPTDLVAEIHKNFTAFDAIIEANGLEKIKTIGDAYLAVCGLPNETINHAQLVVNAALAIQQHINESGSKFQIRIGINSGPVVAGIVGVKKYAYDIWGDAVNTAARMEQHSVAGKINISGSTYELVKEDFTCEYRGKIIAKNKGEVDMYFVTGKTQF